MRECTFVLPRDLFGGICNLWVPHREKEGGPVCMRLLFFVLPVALIFLVPV